MRIPTCVEPASDTQLKIEWSTGEVMTLPYFDLRCACPCASCIDEHTGAKLLKRASVPADIRPKGVKLIGQYALQITWSDRHATGMYHFDRLFEIGQEIALPI